MKGEKAKIAVRDFRPGDIGKLLELREETARISFPGMEMDMEKAKMHILSHVKRHPGTLKVADSGGRPVGYVMFQKKKGSFGDYGYINIISVDEGFRRMGVGKLLLDSAEGWFRSRGIKSAEAAVTNSNGPSADFFRKHGYMGKRTVFGKRI
jgi:ribosomal protein S18 acetylase RimI-like enzyme